MSKKRKCRYTQEEAAIHEEAVRLRKMTDQQLVEAFRKERESAECSPEPKNQSSASLNTSRQGKDTAAVKRLLSELAAGKCKGIKGATVYKIAEFATEMGLI